VELYLTAKMGHSGDAWAVFEIYWTPAEQEQEHKV
jgi:hypothetical protein